MPLILALYYFVHYYREACGWNNKSLYILVTAEF